MTLFFLAAALLTLASLMWWTSSNGKVTQQNELFTTAESAADAATEKVVANLDFDWTYSQALQAASHYQSLPLPDQTGWPMKFQYSDGSGNNGATSVTIPLTNYYAAVGSEFAGLSGYIYPCTITSTATTSNQTYTVSATVQQTLNAVIIPLFQFAIFYNMNLEIDPGAGMAINGPVYSDQDIWAGTPNVTFNSTVAAVGQVNISGTDPWVVHPDSGTPLGNFAIAPLSGRDSLTLPIGNSTNNSPSAVEAVINLVTNGMGAPNAQAYSTNGQMYLFNESDLIISNSINGLASAKGTNITIWFQDPNAAASGYLIPVTNDFYALKIGGSTNVVNQAIGIDSPTNVAYKSYSFVTNVSYYDYRESDTVQAVQVDVSLLNKWLTNTATTGGYSVNKKNYSDNGHGIQSIYVYNNVKPASGSPGTLPAVRMINGAQLPYTTDPNGIYPATSGLTVTTPQPIYVKGDYNVQTAASAAGASAQTTNTANTYPAALVGDAITILSGNWDDGNTASTSLTSGSRNTPSPTTINAAALEGIVQSTNSNYSGGVENFLRLEENWSGVTLQYNGSIAVMFPSIYATSFWPGTGGNFYNAPTRHWSFDYNFTDPSKLPHVSPKVFRMIRATWKGY
jgi:hypothetical protein